MSKPRTPASKAPDDTALAWELAAAAKPHLSRTAADQIHIAIGIGETFDAIDALITAIARDRIPIDEALAATVSAWLDCYLGQNAEPRLRQLIAEASIYPPQHRHTATQPPHGFSSLFEWPLTARQVAEAVRNDPTARQTLVHALIAQAQGEDSDGHARSARVRARRTQPVTYQVRVDLDGAKPPIWRRLLLSSELMLNELHEVLQQAMGWDDSHLHEFLAGKNRMDPFATHYLMQYMLDDGAEGVLEDLVRLDELLTNPKDRLFYWYDFGDDWEHTLVVERRCCPASAMNRPRSALAALVPAHRKTAAVSGDTTNFWQASRSSRTASSNATPHGSRSRRPTKPCVISSTTHTTTRR